MVLIAIYGEVFARRFHLCLVLCNGRHMSGHFALGQLNSRIGNAAIGGTGKVLISQIVSFLEVAEIQ